MQRAVTEGDLVTTQMSTLNVLSACLFFAYEKTSIRFSAEAFIPILQELSARTKFTILGTRHQ